MLMPAARTRQVTSFRKPPRESLPFLLRRCRGVRCTLSVDQIVENAKKAIHVRACAARGDHRRPSPILAIHSHSRGELDPISASHCYRTLDLVLDSHRVVCLLELRFVHALLAGPIDDSLIGEQGLTLLMDRIEYFLVILLERAHGLHRVVQLRERPPTVTKHHGNSAELHILGLPLEQ